MKKTSFSSGKQGKGERSFEIQIDGNLEECGLGFGGTTSSDQLWAHLRAKEELERALAIVKTNIKSWRKSLKLHNDQRDALQRYSLENGDPIP